MTIKNASLTFDSLTESITIPLDRDVATTTSGYFGPATYTVSSSPVSIPETGESTRLTGDDKIILIPQTGLNGKITFTDGNDETKEELFSSTKDFKPGMKYTLSIAFANNALSVAVLESSAWEDINQNLVFE